MEHRSTTTDLGRAPTLYDPAFGPLGYPRFDRRANGVGYGMRERAPDAPPYTSICVCTCELEPDSRRWALRAGAGPGRRVVTAALSPGRPMTAPSWLGPHHHRDYYSA